LKFQGLNNGLTLVEDGRRRPSTELPIFGQARILRVALVGQPNCGKSTLFNSVAGYRSETSNYSGSTVRVTQTCVRLNGMTVELFDVPGIYSLTSSSPAEAAARQLLLESKIDLIINVLDASLLSRSLELTLEVRELGIPMVVCLNMADEAERKGISISEEKLSECLQVPVVKTVARRGDGVQQLFAKVKEAASAPLKHASALRWSRDVEHAIGKIQAELQRDGVAYQKTRLLAIKLLERDDELTRTLTDDFHVRTEPFCTTLSVQRGRPTEAIIMSERHDTAMRIAEEVSEVRTPKSDVRVALDSFLTHPVWGYVSLVAVMAAFFWGVFGVGSALEGLLQDELAKIYDLLAVHIASGTLTQAAIKSLWDGFVGGAAIVLPYLLPFLIGLALLEDIGYLPRVAYLLDGLLHRIGLHGTSMLPMVLGYGCSVPACLATRMLPSRRDRFVASVLATLVPCSARSNVIFALVAFYLGPWWALGVFGLNAVVVLFSGWLLTRMWPEMSAGMVLDVPRYQWPKLSVIARKVWLRLREFVVLSWPLLIGGSLVLGLIEHWHWHHYVNAALSPLTRLLDLPFATGTTLVFGVLRKELSMVMLGQALGTDQINQVMTSTQIVVFTLFVAFYIPCLATIASLVRELGRKLTAYALAYTMIAATVLALIARLALRLVFAH